MHNTICIYLLLIDIILEKANTISLYWSRLPDLSKECAFENYFSYFSTKTYICCWYSKEPSHQKVQTDLGQVWYLIVSIPDLCHLSYFVYLETSFKTVLI